MHSFQNECKKIVGTARKPLMCDGVVGKIKI